MINETVDTTTEVLESIIFTSLPAGLLRACMEAQKHHLGGHSDIGFLLRIEIGKAIK